MNVQESNGKVKSEKSHPLPAAATSAAADKRTPKSPVLGADVEGLTMAPEQLDVPPLSAEDQTALAAFQARQQVLRDLTIGCIKSNHTGAYIYGPPGVSKSYTIQQTLRECKAYWQLHQRITAKPLYLEFEKHPGAIHLIEDCEQLFAEKRRRPCSAQPWGASA